MKKGQDVLDLADVLGRTDFNLEYFNFRIFLHSKIQDFQVPRFPDFQKSGLGQAWAGPGPEIGGAPSAVSSATAPDHKVG